jgi:phage shock protein E
VVDRPDRQRRARVSLLALSALGIAALALWLAARDGDRIGPEELLARIQDGRAPLVLDVRSEREFSGGHVPGALHVPFAEAGERGAVLPGPKDQLVVVYCELGPRAGLAKLALEREGFTNVHYLDGHMAAWRGEGRPLER